LYNDKAGIRFRKVEDIIKELHLLSERGVRNIKILDELFTFREDRVREICDLIIASNYKFNIWAYGRVDRVTPSMLERMKRAGVNWICYGFESANETVRNEVNKHFTQNMMENAIKWTREAGINILGNFMFGFPHDSYDTMRQTFDFAKSHLFEFVNFYCAMAYPGSVLFDNCVNLKMKLPESWSGYSQYSKDAMPSPTMYLTSEQVRDFRDKAFIEYISNPEYLKMVKGKFGHKAEKHIEEMLKWKHRG